jgi:hypothetical protein
MSPVYNKSETCRPGRSPFGGSKGSRPVERHTSLLASDHACKCPRCGMSHVTHNDTTLLPALLTHPRRLALLKHVNKLVRLKIGSREHGSYVNGGLGNKRSLSRTATNTLALVRVHPVATIGAKPHFLASSFLAQGNPPPRQQPRSRRGTTPRPCTHTSHRLRVMSSATAAGALAGTLSHDPRQLQQYHSTIDNARLMRYT